MATKTQDRIKAAEERLKKLKAKSAREKARARAAQSRTARRDETRRKFLVGAVVLVPNRQGIVGGSRVARVDGPRARTGRASGAVQLAGQMKAQLVIRVSTKV